MTTIIAVTFRQGTDVQQVIGLENNKRRCISAILILLDIQQIQLGVSPEVSNAFGKFIVHSQQIVPHPPSFLRHFIHRMYIQEFLICIIKTDTDAAGQRYFRPFHRGIPCILWKYFIQFLGDGRIQNHPASLGYRTYIPKEFFQHRFLAMIHHIVRCQTKGMQSMLYRIIQRKLGGEIVDACRQVGGLQRHILHLLTGNPFQKFAQ